MTGPAETSILVGRGHVAIHNRLVSFGGRLWFFGLIAMILGLGGGWVVATGILDPIRQMAREMAMIRATDLSRRIAIDKTDTELKGLGAAINETLDRLEASFQLQTRFSADASHEMRTPWRPSAASAKWPFAGNEAPRNTGRRCKPPCEAPTGWKAW